MDYGEDWRKEEQRYGAKTYAQHGDDLMLVNIFELLKVDKPSYLDLGAHHPVTISNTCLLYERGSRGINVEANPYLMPLFEKYRPEDKNLNFGVYPIRTKGKFPFYLRDEKSGMNTMCLDTFREMHGDRPIQETMMIETRTPKQIVDEYASGKWPHLLITDLEGLDLAVLRTLDIARNNRPLIVCSEIMDHQTAETIRIMHNLGYKPYCRMHVNMIFVVDELWPRLF